MRTRYERQLLLLLLFGMSSANALLFAVTLYVSTLGLASEDARLDCEAAGNSDEGCEVGNYCGEFEECNKRVRRNCFPVVLRRA